VEESTPPALIDFSMSPCWIQVRDIPLICMNKEVGSKIGETLGKVEEVDVSGEGPGRGSSLRIKIQIDITKPLERGRALWLNGKMVWVNFRYEKLPHFCFNCGRIFHNMEQCSERKEARQDGEEDLKRWGTWLRAEEVRSTIARKWSGTGSMSTPLRQEANDQKGTEGGGEAVTDEKQEEKGETPDHHGGDSNNPVSTNSIGNDTEKQILQSILRKEVRDTKAAETGQLPSPKRRSDLMELMPISEQLEMELYPPVNEGSTKKSTGDNNQEGNVRDHTLFESNVGLPEDRGGNPQLEVGPGLDLDPLGIDSGDGMEGIRENNFGQEIGPTRRWKRRSRPPSLSPDQSKGGKRDLFQAEFDGDSTEGGKKARLDVKTGIEMAWAEAGYQPRQPQ
jgi:hypothetical protein